MSYRLYLGNPTASSTPPAAPNGWQSIATNAAVRVALVVATQATLSFVVPTPAAANVPSGWQSQCPKAPAVAKAQQGQFFVPFNTAQVVTVPRGWQGQPSVAPKPAKANPTQATSFQVPEQTAPAVDNNTTAKGWYPPLAGAPKTAQARQSQATSFQTPEQTAPAVDNNTLSKAWHQDLSRPVAVAKARQGHSFVPFNTAQIVVSPQTVPLVQDSSATYTFPVYYQAFVYPPQYIAPPVDNDTTSKGWQQPLSGAPKTAKAKQSQATSFQTPEQSGVTPTPTPEKFGWFAALSKSAPVAKAKQGQFFVPFDTVQIVVSPQTVPLIQDAGAVYDRPVYYQATIAPPAYLAPNNSVTSLTWQQPLSKAARVAKAQQGASFVPLNTAQVQPAGIAGMAWHMPLGKVAARLLAAPQGWAFVPFDTVQVAPVVVEPRRGGATYLTREEMRELARAQREIDKKKRRDDEAITETIREAYQDIVNPNLKIERQRAAEEDDDEEALIMLMMRHLLEERDE